MVLKKNCFTIQMVSFAGYVNCNDDLFSLLSMYTQRITSSDSLLNYSKLTVLNFARLTSRQTFAVDGLHNSNRIPRYLRFSALHLV